MQVVIEVIVDSVGNLNTTLEDLKNALQDDLQYVMKCL